MTKTEKKRELKSLDLQQLVQVTGGGGGGPLPWKVIPAGTTTPQPWTPDAKPPSGTGSTPW